MRDTHPIAHAKAARHRYPAPADEDRNLRTEDYSWTRLSGQYRHVKSDGLHRRRKNR